MFSTTTVQVAPFSDDTLVLEGFDMDLGELDLAYEVEMDALLNDLRGFERLDAALREIS
ncbi:hypothetical protein [Gephyromycinifex aptenodytis]|uniref:hypothetical protein n=1 Tax=Gephyromycinifex aptenodytis TaxID=2716227 RepID=UPI001446B58E|nr:hypothetical protein [Gephyromycinifex aptenodytis]